MIHLIAFHGGVLASLAVLGLLVVALRPDQVGRDVRQFAHYLAKTRAASNSFNFNAASLPGDWLYSSRGMSWDAYLDLDPSGLHRFTREAQELIYANQFRTAEQCSQAIFVSSDLHSGIGSEWHVASALLADAMNRNAIFTWGPESGKRYTAGEHCKNAAQNWLCFLREPTNCTFNPLREVNHLAKFFGERNMSRERNAVPKKLGALWMEVEPSMDKEELIYWWRAQGTAFLARFNDRTLEALRELRGLPNVTLVAGQPDSANGSVSPLPRGTISAHVRHGDKGTEMKLVPWESYANASLLLAGSNPFRLKPRVFLSTDNQSVVAEAANLKRSLEVFYTDMFRQSDNSPVVEVLKHHRDYTLYYLLQLLMALECDAWVGTRESNWNRAIDELRCVWVPNCDLPFVEVGQMVKLTTRAW